MSLIRQAHRRVGLNTAGSFISSRGWLAGALAAAVLLLVVGIFAWRTGGQLEELAALGYPGLFLVMVIAGAGTMFPMPGQAAVLMAGALWNPVLVGVVAGLGNATGELAGYAAGRAGVAALGGRTYRRCHASLEKWIERYGFFTMLVIALVPNPLFDVAGLIAGSLCYPIRRFWLACALGNAAKYVGYAYLGEAARWWLA